MNRTHAEQILADLVAIPSVTEDRRANEGALDYIEDNLREQDMHVERLSYTEVIGDREAQEYGALVATTNPTKTPRVMLSAHVDVVPGPEELFELRQDGEKLYGRGVSDMKNAIAAFLVAVSILRHDESLKAHDFGITIVTNEEIGGKGVENTLKDGFVPEVVVLPDSGKDWRIEKVAKGAWNVLAEASGVAAHGSRPWDGDSASFRLLDFLGNVREMFENQGPETDTLNIARLNAGLAQNQVPASASATLDIRVMSLEDQSRIQAKIDKLCRAHGVSYKLLAHFPPVQHDMENPYIRMFRESLKAVRGVDEGDYIAPGASDAVYYDQLGIPTIAVRPTGGGEHADDEWLDRKSFQQFIDVLVHFIRHVSRS